MNPAPRSVRGLLVAVCALLAFPLAGCAAANQQAQTAPSAAPSAETVTGDSALAWLTKVPKPKKKYNIGVAIPNMPDPSWQTVWYGIQYQCEQLGVSCRVADAGGYSNLQAQIGQLENFTQLKMDGIIVGAADSSGVVPAVTAASDAGITIVDGEVAENSGRASASVINNQADIGAAVGDYIGKALGGKGGVVLLSGPSGNATLAARANGFKNKLQTKYPGIKIVGERFSNISAAEGLNIMQDFLQSNPGQIQGVYTASGPLAAAVASAIAAQKPAGKIYIGTAGATPATFDQLRPGTIDMIADQQNVMQGRVITNIMVTRLNGGAVPKLTQTPIRQVTAENVSSIDLTVSLPPNGWKP